MGIEYALNPANHCSLLDAGDVVAPKVESLKICRNLSAREALGVVGVKAVKKLVIYHRCGSVLARFNDLESMTDEDIRKPRPSVGADLD